MKRTVPVSATVVVVLVLATMSSRAEEAPKRLASEKALEEASSDQAHAGAPSIKFSGLFETRIDRVWRRRTFLVPWPAFLGETREAGTAKGALTLDARAAPVRLGAQLRMLGEHVNGEDRGSVHLDEAFVEIEAGTGLFVFAGRRNVAIGKAYSISPLDVLLYRRSLDRSLGFEQRRTEIAGTDMVGVDAFLDGFSVRAAFAPHAGALNPERGHEALIKIDALVPQFNADITLLGYWSRAPRLGLGHSMTIGDATVVYGESTVQRGRDRTLVRPTGPMQLGQFTLDEDRGGVFARFTLGVGHTFQSGLSVNLEYVYDGTGYNQRSWNAMTSIAELNRHNLGQVNLGRLAIGNLKNLNGAMRLETLRQHYAFLRAAQDKFLRDDLRLEATILYGLEDRSGVAALRLEWQYTPFTTGIYLTSSYGGNRSEFGLRSLDRRAVSYVSLRF